jgi:hypothetical protein
VSKISKLGFGTKLSWDFAKNENKTKVDRSTINLVLYNLFEILFIF